MLITHTHTHTHTYTHTHTKVKLVQCDRALLSSAGDVQLLVLPPWSYGWSVHTIEIHTIEIHTIKIHTIEMHVAPHTVLLFAHGLYIHTSSHKTMEYYKFYVWWIVMDFPSAVIGSSWVGVALDIGYDVAIGGGRERWSWCAISLRDWQDYGRITAGHAHSARRLLQAMPIHKASVLCSQETHARTHAHRHRHRHRHRHL